LIFITLGTVLPYDQLIEKIDIMKGSGVIGDEMYAQIGSGSYIPKHIKYLRYVGNMEAVYKKADIVISTCGAGTLLENVTQGRRIIAIENPAVTTGHAWELVFKLEALGCLIWCRDIKDILPCINEARTKKFRKFEPDSLDITTLKGLIEGRR